MCIITFRVVLGVPACLREYTKNGIESVRSEISIMWLQESSYIFCWWDILLFGMKTSTNSTNRSKLGLMTWVPLRFHSYGTTAWVSTYPWVPMFPPSSPRQSGTRSLLKPKTSSIRCWPSIQPRESWPRRLWNTRGSAWVLAATDQHKIPTHTHLKLKLKDSIVLPRWCISW